MQNTERNVAIVGAGLIGRAWAAIFARAGWNVRLTDPHIPTLKAAPRLIRDELHALARHGLASDPDGAVTRVSVAASLQEAVLDVEFVQENGPEKVEDKQAIFAQLDRLAPSDALLASSTSAIVASRFTETLPGRARCLVGHPVNPPHLIPLVELCGAPWTSPAAIRSDLGHRRVALYRNAARPCALPGRPSRQSAASDPAGRTLRRAVDLARGDQIGPRPSSRRALPKRCPAVRVAWSAIPSIRRI